ncbi:serine protease [Streptomyces griseochromogenes]|uniref:Serine protease n=1 Tax=Streptomyces griseochromogenes TaxID=68214 RepID=A0ABS4M9Q2_9ACTN|nr:S8 family peptidase [Streptomyces griseochromogenes]MBP2056405.1 serine protease [Streptomyces griseochromogenes]
MGNTPVSGLSSKHGQACCVPEVVRCQNKLPHRTAAARRARLACSSSLATRGMNTPTRWGHGHPCPPATAEAQPNRGGRSRPRLDSTVSQPGFGMPGADPLERQTVNPHRKSRRGRILVATALGTTLLVGAVTTAMAGQGSSGSGNSASPVLPKSAPTASEPVSDLVIGYKSKAQEAHSETAVRAGISAAAAKTGLKLSYERRLSVGAALVSLGGAQPAKDVTKLMDHFRADPDVAYAVPNGHMQAQSVTSPNDPRFAEQWDLTEPTAGMNVQDAWGTTTGKGVTVAVLDDGIAKHSDLDANVIQGADLVSNTFTANDGDGRDDDPSDPGDGVKKGECGKDLGGKPLRPEDEPSSWHGTHMAGIIAAPSDNGNGIAGVAPGAKLEPVRVLGRCGGNDADISDGIMWAAGEHVDGVSDNQTPANVINMSLGSKGDCSPIVQSAIDKAVQLGSTVVVAAGNRGKEPAPVDASQFTPANCKNIITVAAADREGNRAEYSNFGQVDITAPGGDIRKNDGDGILSTFNSGTGAPAAENFAFEVGTSQATAHVSGLVALMLSANPELTPAEIKTAIQANARPIPGKCDGGCGAGLADAAKTVAAAAKGVPGSGSPSDSASGSPSDSPSDSASDSPSDAPASPDAPPTTSAPSDGSGSEGAGAGTDLSACLHDSCQVEVTGGDTIQLDGADGVDELEINSVSANAVDMTGASGSGSQSAKQSAPGTSQLNNLVVDIIKVDGDRATIRLS